MVNAAARVKKLFNGFRLVIAGAMIAQLILWSFQCFKPMTNADCQPSCCCKIATRIQKEKPAAAEAAAGLFFGEVIRAS